MSRSDSLLDCSASPSAGDDEAAAPVPAQAAVEMIVLDYRSRSDSPRRRSNGEEDIDDGPYTEDDGAVAGPSRPHHQQPATPQSLRNAYYYTLPNHLTQPQRQPRNDEDENYREFCEQFQFENSQCCWICNGYYAPSFGEPVCGVCHAFVFSVPSHVGIKVQFTMVSDDEDSGNDEPPYNAGDNNRAGADGEPDEADEANEDEDDDEGDEDDEDDEDDAVVDDDDDAARLADPAMELEVRDDADPVGEELRFADEPEPPMAEDVRDAAAARMAAAAEAGRAIVAAADAAIIDAYHNKFAGLRPPAAAPLNVNQFIDLLSQPYAVAGGGAAGGGGALPTGIDALPVEVLLAIFKNLDDVSLWHVSKVCRRWHTILEGHIPPTMWQRYVHERWPLYKPSAAVELSSNIDWYRVYNELMGSTCCRSCLVQMGLKRPLQGRITRFRSTRLMCDFQALQGDRIEGIAAEPLDKTLSHWQATIVGPAASPYAGGKFFLYLVFPCQYPMQPPVVRFLTKIIHPNVSRHGDVGCDIIQHNWSLALSIPKLLLSVQSLLTDPYTEICMEPQVGRLYAEDRPKFNALARTWTRKYAMLELL